MIRLRTALLLLFVAGCATVPNAAESSPRPRGAETDDGAGTGTGNGNGTDLLASEIGGYLDTAQHAAFRHGSFLAAADPQDGENKPEGGAAAMAKALQDPLANIAALMTENDIFFGTGDEAKSAVFQLQPVYSVNFEKFSIIPRGIIPIVGAAPESDLPGLGEPRPSGGSTTWGLGDIVIQAFWAPRAKGNWKWGAGPQVSLRTRTDARVGGPGWGAGAAAVVVGDIGNLSVSFLANNQWGQDGFNTMTLQPMLFYNVPSIPGFTINYTGPTTADWSASASNRWTVPLGAGVSKTFAVGGGYGIDVLAGAYYYVVSPDGGPDWSFKFNVSILFPR